MNIEHRTSNIEHRTPASTPVSRFRPVYWLIALAVVLIILGIILGENEATLRNAHYLCLECLGIG